MGQQQAVADSPQALRAQIGPDQAHVAESGQTEPAQAEPQTGQQVDHADQGGHPERRQHLPRGAEHDPGGGIDILGGQGQHGDLPEFTGDGQNAFRHHEQTQNAVAEKPAAHGHQQAQAQAAQHGGAHVALGAAHLERAQRLADRSRGPAGHGHDHHHQKNGALGHHAQGGLHFSTDLPGDPDRDEAHEEHKVHHEHLGPGQPPDRTRRSAQVRRGHANRPYATLPRISGYSRSSKQRARSSRVSRRRIRRAAPSLWISTSTGRRR